MSLPVKLWPGSDNNLSNPAKTILRNRGIDDYKEYMNLSDKALYSPYLLKNIEAAADLFIKHILSPGCSFSISAMSLYPFACAIFVASTINSLSVFALFKKFM